MVLVGENTEINPKDKKIFLFNNSKTKKITFISLHIDFSDFLFHKIKIPEFIFDKCILSNLEMFLKNYKKRRCEFVYYFPVEKKEFLTLILYGDRTINFTFKGYSYMLYVHNILDYYVEDKEGSVKECEGQVCKVLTGVIKKRK